MPGQRSEKEMRRLANHLRFWMIGVLVAVVAVLEGVTGLPGWWSLIVYGGAVLFFAAVIFAVVDREGSSMAGRRDFQHGRDMHGHYP